MSQRSRKILLVGGGTGGHVVPVFEIYKKLREADRELEITILGSGTEIEKHFFAGNPHYKVIPAGKLRRHWTVKNIKEFLFVLLGFGQTLHYLLLHRPDVIFSKGGYVALPIIFWAKVLRIAFVIHESDTEMGIGNKVGVAKARKIFVSFPGQYYPRLPRDRSVFSAPIIREQPAINTAGARLTFGFANDKPVIFVTGGSQGAVHINENVVKALPFLLPKFNIIHQSGDFSYERMRDVQEGLSSDLKRSYFLTDFLRVEDGGDMMLLATEAADLVIARAGATTIFELAARGKPMILIPWKHASADHQSRNARIIAEAGAAMVIPDDELTSSLLLERIDECFADNRIKMAEMSDRARQLFPGDGLERVTETLLKMISEAR